MPTINGNTAHEFTCVSITTCLQPRLLNVNISIFVELSQTTDTVKLWCFTFTKTLLQTCFLNVSIPSFKILTQTSNSLGHEIQIIQVPILMSFISHRSDSLTNERFMNLHCKIFLVV